MGLSEAKGFGELKYRASSRCPSVEEVGMVGTVCASDSYIASTVHIDIRGAYISSVRSLEIYTNISDHKFRDRSNISYTGKRLDNTAMPCRCTRYAGVRRTESMQRYRTPNKDLES